MAGNSARLSKEALDEARREVAFMHRPINEQSELWMRIDIAIERTPDYDHDQVKSAFTSRLQIDALSEREKAVLDAGHETLIKEPARR